MKDEGAAEGMRMEGWAFSAQWHVEVLRFYLSVHLTPRGRGG